MRFASTHPDVLATWTADGANMDAFFENMLEFEAALGHKILVMRAHGEKVYVVGAVTDPGPGWVQYDPGYDQAPYFVPTDPTILDYLTYTFADLPGIPKTYWVDNECHRPYYEYEDGIVYAVYPSCDPSDKVDTDMWEPVT